MSDLSVGDRVRVVRHTRGSFHYAPVGAVGRVVEDGHDDVTHVRFDGPVTSTTGRVHKDGFLQIVPLVDLVKIGDDQ